MFSNKDEGMFSQQSVRDTGINATYKSRVNKSSSLFDDDEPEEDDTKIDDLDLAAEMVTYEKPTMKTWHAHKKDNLFTDTTAEEEEVRMASL